MTLAEYRKLRGITQPKLAEELSEITPGIDAPLISKMERGICAPSLEIQEYLDAQEAIIGQDVIELNGTEADIFYALLPCSYDNRRTRQELSIMTKMSDRAVRRTIENMRLKGIRICSDSDYAGYYITTDESEYMMFRGTMIARLKSLAKTIKAMDNYTKGQISL